VRDAIVYSYNGDAFQRIVYSESHDEVANGKARVLRKSVLPTRKVSSPKSGPRWRPA